MGQGLELVLGIYLSCITAKFQFKKIFGIAYILFGQFLFLV